jgi:transcriptional regulator with XRE-family HTH domain
MPTPLPDDATIGDRLRRLRTERGLTQERLAEIANLSVDMIKKLEQNRRESARLSTLNALADALDIPRSQLLDKRPRLNGPGSRLVLGLRDVLLSPDVLVGIDMAHDDGAPTDVDELWRQVAVGWSAYWEGRFAELAELLPPLIDEARITERTLGAAVSGPLAQAYQLAACLLVHLGREDLAAIGAERGLIAARGGDDELQAATLHGTYAWALLGQARHLEGERFAFAAAQQIEPVFSKATPGHITVWGGLVLWAMAAAVQGGRADAAAEYIRLAKAGAIQLGEPDRHDYQTNFGPTQVAMQETYAYATLGEPGRALDASRAVHRQDLPTISYGRHLLDVAQAQHEARKGDPVQTLAEARNLAPVWWRHQPEARALTTEIVERRSRPSSVLRDLLHSLDGR